MQATLREFEDWLEDSVPDAVMIAYEKALAKLEECLPYEDTLVGSVSKQELKWKFKGAVSPIFCVNLNSFKNII